MVTRRARSTVRSLSRSLTRPARYGSGSHQLHLSSKRGPPPFLQRVPERRRRKGPSVLVQRSERRRANRLWRDHDQMCTSEIGPACQHGRRISMSRDATKLLTDHLNELLEGWHLVVSPPDGRQLGGDLQIVDLPQHNAVRLRLL